MDKKIRERILQAVEELCGGNRSDFCRRIGRNSQAIKDIIGGKLSMPGYDLLFDILSSDLEISPSWLMLGEGPMRIDKTPTRTKGNDVHHNNVVIIGNLGDLKEVVAEAIRENK